MIVYAGTQDTDVKQVPSVVHNHRMIHTSNFKWIKIKSIILFNINITGFTYNRTCCKEKGVPENCIGLCTLNQTRQGKLPPINACEQWINATESCVVHGMVNLKQRWLTNIIIFYPNIVLIYSCSINCFPFCQSPM